MFLPKMKSKSWISALTTCSALLSPRQCTSARKRSKNHPYWKRINETVFICKRHAYANTKSQALPPKANITNE